MVIKAKSTHCARKPSQEYNEYKEHKAKSTMSNEIKKAKITMLNEVNKSKSTMSNEVNKAMSTVPDS